MNRYYNLFIVYIVFSFLSAGCNQPLSTTQNTSSTKTASPLAHSKTAHAEDGHDHKPGSHNGLIVSLGDDRYHAEVVFETGGKIKLYTLGQDESIVKEIDEQVIEGHIKLAGSSFWQPISLKSAPQTGDTKGKSSQFAGIIPSDYIGKHVIVKFSAIRIGKERYRIAFDSGEHDGHDSHSNPSIDPLRENHTEMPMKVAQSDEQKLYLTPGGKYTTADIKANGNVVASEKFKNIKADHDLKPKAGDKICPITLTKANSKFSWIIDGKNYEFCCPPCVDEFVSLSKEKPNELKAPESYIMK